MSSTILPCWQLRAVPHSLWRMLDIGLAALGQSWLDSIQFRCGAPEPEWSPRHRDADEEMRLMVALSCAGFY